MGIRRILKNFFYRLKYQNKKVIIKNIKNKSILITGANSGIGLALVKELLLHNNILYATYNTNYENLNKIKNSKLKVIRCNNENFEDLVNLKRYILNLPINIIINNAGVWGQQNQDIIEDINSNNLISTLKINSISIIVIINIILKYCKKNCLETIVNISSSAGSIKNNLSGGAYIYRASKALQNSLTKNISIDLSRRFNIKTFAVDPGNIRTKMNTNGLLSSELCAKKILKILETQSHTTNGRFIDLNENDISW